MNWRDNLIESQEGILEILEQSHRIAVLGIKIEKESYKPAFYVPEYLARVGYEIIPVPVYFPEVTEILNRKVYRRIDDVPGEIDIVNVFRRSNAINAHVDDILRKQPKVVWFQLGIRNDNVAQRFAEAGIKVVQDRCMMSEHARLLRTR